MIENAQGVLTPCCTICCLEVKFDSTCYIHGETLSLAVLSASMPNPDKEDGITNQRSHLQVHQ